MPPKGGILGMISRGTDIISEYREHCKSQKVLPESSQPSQTTEDPECPSVNGQSTLSYQEPSQPQSTPHIYSEDIVSGSSHIDTTTSHESQPMLRNPSGRNIRKSFDDCHSNYDSSTMLEAAHVHKDALSVVDIEEEWQLDEIVPQPPSTSPYQHSHEARDANAHDVEMPVGDPTFYQPEYAMKSATWKPLPCPVIIPQRRPGDSSRGFIRAYAPVLNDCGINQETFLKFLKDFHQSSQADSIYKIINTSAGIAGFAPSVTAMVVTTVAQLGSSAAITVQSRKRTNDFLDRMNEELFKPAGLYSFIMKLSPGQDDGSSGTASMFGIQPQAVDVNTHQIIATYDPSLNASTAEHSSKWSSFRQSMRTESGTTHGSTNLVVSAPLIFPHINDAVARDGKEGFKAKAKDASKFLASYFDRQAQAKYANENPNSSLVLPEYQREHGLSDDEPLQDDAYLEQNSERRLSHHSGDRSEGGTMGRERSGLLASRLSGRRNRMDRGERSHGPVGSLIRMAMNHGNESSTSSVPYRQQSVNTSSGQASFYDSPSEVGLRGLTSRFQDGRGNYQEKGRGRASNVRMVKRSMASDVFYLMIVNMPSDHELEVARQTLASQHKS